MVETLYIIRHGATEGSDDGEPRYKGSIDVPLSDKGKKQIADTASFMKAQGMRPDAVYCSTLSRARVSAEIICRAFDGFLKPLEVEEFKERHFGLWEGMSFSEIASEFPNDFSAWANDPLNFSPLEGESTLQVRDSIMPKLNEILGSQEGAVALVAHGGVNRIILCELMGLSLEHIFRIEQDNACLNIVRFHDGSSNHAPVPVIKLINGGGMAPFYLGL